MAGKSPTELIRDLQLEVARLTEQLSSLKEEVRKAELFDTRDRLTKLEATLETVDVPAVLVQLGVIQEQISELKKWREELEKKRWQLIVLFGGCLLTLSRC
jgi:hypothetical protein